MIFVSLLLLSMKTKKYIKKHLFNKNLLMMTKIKMKLMVPMTTWSNKQFQSTNKGNMSKKRSMMCNLYSMRIGTK